METTFQILEVILTIYKKHGYTQISNITNGLNCNINTKGTYLLKSPGNVFDELHTPFGSIKLRGNIESDLSTIILQDILSQLKGRFITPNNEYYLITHIHSNLIQYPIVRTTVTSIDEIYNYLYFPRSECMNWNMTRAFYDSEIQRLVTSGWLTDDLSLLRELQEDSSLMNYERIIALLCELNTCEDCLVVEFRKIVKSDKNIHILGLVLLSGTMIHTH